MRIKVITSNATSTYLPTTHQLLRTIRIFLMEVKIIMVKDQFKTINRITFNLDSKDKIKEIQGLTIKGCLIFVKIEEMLSYFFSNTRNVINIRNVL